MPIDTTYQKKAEETIPQYNERIVSYNASKTPTTPATPAPAYVPRYTANEQAASDYLDTFQSPQTAEQIQAQKMQAAQGQIDALNRHYDDLLAEQKTVNEGRSRSTDAVSVLTGLAGSSEAGRAANETTQINQRDNAKIMNERAVAIQSILGNIRASAVEEARQSRLDARASAEDILKRKTERAQEAVTQLTDLAKGGVTADGLRASDPDSYAHLAQQVGGEQRLKALFTLNRPQDTILDKRVENGYYIVATQNPLTGKIQIESTDLGLPPEYSKSVDAGDRLLFMPSNWDGDTSKIIAIGKGLTPGQAASRAAGAGANTQLYSGLSSATATAVRAKVNKYSTEPIVQNFATIQEGYNFATSIDTQTKNPADDQALIYSLAKALDPGSVVREGEYATAQKYAQSWVNAYGKGISQAIAGTGFLSKSARENIKKTIESKYQSSKRSYNNVNNQYIQNINSLTGRADGENFLVDYVTPTQSQQSDQGGDDYSSYLEAIGQ